MLLDDVDLKAIGEAKLAFNLHNDLFDGCFFSLPEIDFPLFSLL